MLAVRVMGSPSGRAAQHSSMWFSSRYICPARAGICPARLVRAGNEDLLKRAYVKLHPRSADKWDAATGRGGAAQAVAIQKLFETTRKGDFAQLVAEEINNGAAFTVPAYLKTAIEALLK